MTSPKNTVLPLYYFWLIFLATASLRVTLTSLGSLMEVIATDLMLTKFMVSMLLSIPIICMGVCALLAKPLSDRLGLERTITLSLLAIAFATVLRSVSNNVVILIIASFIMGTGIAIVGPLASGFVKRHFGKQTPKGMMLYSLGISASGIAGTIGSWVFSYYFNWSWSLSLGVWAFPILLIGLFWATFYLLPKPTQQKKKQESAEPLPWGNVKAWILMLCFGLQSGIFYTLIAWLIPYLLESGINESHANIMLNLMMFSGLVGSFIFPTMLARYRESFVVYFASISIIILLLLLSIGGSNLYIAYGTITILGAFASSGIFIIVMSLPFNEVNNGNAVASWTAVMLFGGYIISAIIPTLFGFVYDVTASYNSVMWGLVISSIVLLVCLFLFLNLKTEATGKSDER